MSKEIVKPEYMNYDSYLDDLERAVNLTKTTMYYQHWNMIEKTWEMAFKAGFHQGRIAERIAEANKIDRHQEVKE